MHFSAFQLRSLSRRLLTAMAVFLLMAFVSPDVKAQRLALKTNSLEYLMLTPNLTVEARLSRKLSLQMGLAVNPISRPIADIVLKNFRVEPELRYWFNRPMARHFVALSFTAADYSVRIKDRYYKGDVVAGGFSYGYALVLSRHWNMEVEIGIGLGSFRGYHYTGENNQPDMPNFRKVLPVPMRCALTFGYIFK